MRINLPVTIANFRPTIYTQFNCALFPDEMVFSSYILNVINFLFPSILQWICHNNIGSIDFMPYAFHSERRVRTHMHILNEHFQFQLILLVGRWWKCYKKPKNDWLRAVLFISMKQLHCNRLEWSLGQMVKMIKTECINCTL